jgi:hypothetical protein
MRYGIQRTIPHMRGMVRTSISFSALGAAPVPRIALEFLANVGQFAQSDRIARKSQEVVPD